MTPAISVLAIGSEILDGRVLESNAQHVARFLTDRGAALHAVVTCDDDEAQIHATLDYLARDSAVIIVSGGLGPTTDDLTRESISTYTGKTLKLNQEILDRLKALYAERKRTFDPTNTKQALLPEGASTIPNPIGTAAGFYLQHRIGERSITIASLPGVPREFKVMFDATVAPLIESALGDSARFERRVFRMFGIPEAVIGGKIEQLSLPPELSISYRASFPEIQVVLKAKASAKALLNQGAESVNSTFGDGAIFSTDLEHSFEECVLTEFKKQRVTFACAESCTGGMIGSFITNVPGSSECFLGSSVTYSNESKTTLLGIPAELVRSCGAVSAEVATAMAVAVREKFAADYAVSVTGIAGPGGGTPEKPVGTVFLGFASARESTALHLFYASNRSFVRRFAAYAALDLLRRKLLGLPLSTHGFDSLAPGSS